MGMGDKGKWLLWLLPKGWDLRDGAAAFGVGSGGWSWHGATQEPRLGPWGPCRLLPPSAGVGTRGLSFLFLIYLHLSLDCHGVCLPNIFPCL